MQERRRTFLKLATAGVSGVALGWARLARAAWPKTGTLDINPKISNMLVVACKDQAMLKGTPSAMSFSAQTAVVDSARVGANLDAMAMRLANTTTPEEAWKTIFRSGNPWATTRVAIKINVTETKNMPRLAVVEKLCRVIAGLGVPASNIIVYDGGPQAFASATSNYTSYFSTTDASKIPGVVSNLNDALGGTTDAPLPDGTSATCTADIAKGKVDILVNIAINKGHIYYGKASLCMKNHYGTFIANHDANYLFNINKSDALLGGNPPRQQLCIVDSLFANKTYNSSPEAMPYYLVMGTFAPAVDYLTVKKVREEVMGVSHDSSIIDTYPTTFGYTTKDPQWVLVQPGSPTADAGAGSGGTTAGSGGTAGNAGSGGKTGSGGAGGSRATIGDAPGGRSGGAPGSGGTGSGGAGSGGSTGSGPNTQKTGGATGSGGQGSPPSSSGGAQGSGGTTAAAGSGGDLGSGGSGGALSSHASATGGATVSTSSTDGTPARPGDGCGCRIGKVQASFAGFSVAMTVGALLVGQLRRLLLRQETLAAPKPHTERAPDTQDR
jgi:hypothetical protein